MFIALFVNVSVTLYEGAYHGGNDIGTTSLFPRHQKPYPQPDPTSAGIVALICSTIFLAFL